MSSCLGRPAPTVPTSVALLARQFTREYLTPIRGNVTHQCHGVLTLRACRQCLPVRLRRGAAAGPGRGADKVPRRRVRLQLL